MVDNSTNHYIAILIRIDGTRIIVDTARPYFMKAEKMFHAMGYKDVINLGGINTAAKTLGLNIVK